MRDRFFSLSFVQVNRGEFYVPGFRIELKVFQNFANIRNPSYSCARGMASPEKQGVQTNYPPLQNAPKPEATKQLCVGYFFTQIVNALPHFAQIILSLSKTFSHEKTTGGRQCP